MALAATDAACQSMRTPKGSALLRLLIGHARFCQSRPFPAYRPLGHAALSAAGAGFGRLGAGLGCVLWSCRCASGRYGAIIYLHVPTAWLGMVGGARLPSPALSRSSGVTRWRDCRARRRVAGCGVYGGLPDHRLDLGPPGLGHVVGVGRATDLDAGAVVPLFRLYGAGAAARGSQQAGQGQGRITAILALWAR
jgi:hypothetical protein